MLLALFMCRHDFCCHYSGRSPGFLNRLLLKLVPMQACAGDVLFESGELADCMYFIVHGRVRIVTSNLREVICLSSGSYLGEVSLLVSSLRCCTARCQTFCELLTLSCVDFLETLAEVPDEAQHFLGVAQRILNESQSGFPLHVPAPQGLSEIVKTLSEMVLPADMEIRNEERCRSSAVMPPQKRQLPTLNSPLGDTMSNSDIDEKLNRFGLRRSISKRTGPALVKHFPQNQPCNHNMGEATKFKRNREKDWAVTKECITRLRRMSAASEYSSEILNAVSGSTRNSEQRTTTRTSQKTSTGTSQKTSERQVSNHHTSAVTSFQSPNRDARPHDINNSRVIDHIAGWRVGGRRVLETEHGNEDFPDVVTVRCNHAGESVLKKNPAVSDSDSGSEKKLERAAEDKLSRSRRSSGYRWAQRSESTVTELGETLVPSVNEAVQDQITTQGHSLRDLNSCQKQTSCDQIQDSRDVLQVRSDPLSRLSQHHRDSVPAASCEALHQRPWYRGVYKKTFRANSTQEVEPSVSIKNSAASWLQSSSSVQSHRSDDLHSMYPSDTIMSFNTMSSFDGDRNHRGTGDSDLTPEQCRRFHSRLNEALRQIPEHAYNPKEEAELRLQLTKSSSSWLTVPEIRDCTSVVPPWAFIYVQEDPSRAITALSQKSTATSAGQEQTDTTRTMAEHSIPHEKLPNHPSVNLSNPTADKDESCGSWPVHESSDRYAGENHLPDQDWHFLQPLPAGRSDLVQVKYGVNSDLPSSDNYVVNSGDSKTCIDDQNTIKMAENIKAAELENQNGELAATEESGRTTPIETSPIDADVVGDDVDKSYQKQTTTGEAPSMESTVWTRIAVHQVLLKAHKQKADMQSKNNGIFKRAIEKQNRMNR
eukprot:GHVQ01037636.1.p1 GENE.GHVQ01037636.1~~GHVQ01037636.1.p1  ORF type:complete len:877 (-),score=91.97 GHVQ01037636.1:458-3088(-)